MILRPPRLDELPYLSDLCLRSKAVWDYDEAMLDAFKDELTLTEVAQKIQSREVSATGGFARCGRGSSTIF